MFLKSRTAKLGAIAVFAASVAVLAGCTTTDSDSGASAETTPARTNRMNFVRSTCTPEKRAVSGLSPMA